jgi:acyl-CoA synthetase (AMP-forming)/AMP-acid ligase II
MRVGRLAVAELSETIDLDTIVAGLPNRIHQVADSYVAKFPDRVALLEDGASLTYRELDRSKSVPGSLGGRAGDPMIIVSETCIALAALPLAASRIDAWAIVANPRS